MCYHLQCVSYVWIDLCSNVVAGHKNILAFGLMGSGEGVPVVAMLGRVRICFLDGF